MNSKVQKWAYGFLGGMIGGGASSLGAWLGLTAAKAVGIDVPTLNFKAMGVIFLSGLLSNGVAYLAKSPLPELQITTDTLTVTTKTTNEIKTE